MNTEQYSITYDKPQILIRAYFWKQTPAYLNDLNIYVLCAAFVYSHQGRPHDRLLSNPHWEAGRAGNTP